MSSIQARRMVKRAMDITMALLLLIVTAPVVAAVVPLIWFRLGPPVFFVQERTGRSLRRFRIFKLRTMTEERDAHGRLLTDAERCPGLGRFLRRLSIDELPQLVNVIRGELSLVGPRPLIPRYDPWYTERELVRFTVRPGITGLAQVNGRNYASWNRRLELDVRYVTTWSLWLDLKILLWTVGRVLCVSGVAVDPAGHMLDLDKERELSARS